MKVFHSDVTQELIVLKIIMFDATEETFLVLQRTRY